MKDENTLYWLWLAEKCGIASNQFGRLIEKYDNPFDIYLLEDDEVEQLDGISTSLKAKLCQKNLDTSYGILKYCKENHVDIISYGDRRYPLRMKSMIDPPVVLYCRGHFPDFNSLLCIGMVGTRRMSEYGKQSAYKIGYELSAAGAVVVSGMALGIDGVSACGALEAGGTTVAVLGCGISVVYPKEHKRLMEDIARKGAVITEYPPEEPPRGHNFPKRNRIISGLCQGVVIVECPAESGAMITAKTAINQGREVFALPGKIDDGNSDGPNELIQQGAYTVLSTEDVLKHYEFLYRDVTDWKAMQRASRKLRPEDVDKVLEKYGVNGNKSSAKTEKKEIAAKGASKDKKISAAEVGKTERVSGAEENAGESLADNSAELLAGLDDFSKKIFESMPIDKPISPDNLTAMGIDAGKAITALSMLELVGLVSALPGGLYVRK